MRTVTMIKSTAIILFAGLGLCQMAWASLGLGEARVQSFLGQNLNVEIALVGSEVGSLDSLQVVVADADDYSRLGVPVDALALGLSVTLDPSVDPPVIRLRSSRAMEDPFAQVLIDARWSSGRILREYTLFIDPPAVPVAPPIRRAPEPEPASAEAPAEVPPPPADVEATAETERLPEPVAAEAPQEPPLADSPEAVPAETDDVSVPLASDSTGPASVVAQNGDTLWSIAADWRPADLTMHQAMMALFDRNPDAFMDDNINRLRRGARLALPRANEARVLPRAEATRRFQEQIRAWEAARAASSPAVLESAPEATPAPVTEPPPQPEPVVEPEAVEEPTDAVAEVAEPPIPEEEATFEEDAPADQTAAASNNQPVAAEPPAQPRLELTPPDEDELAETAAIAAERDRLTEQLNELQAQITDEGLDNAEISALVDQARQAIESADAGGMMVASEDLARLEAQLREAREDRAAQQQAEQAAAAASEPEAPSQSPEMVREPPAVSFLERWMWPLVGVAGGLVLLMTLLGIRRRRTADADEPAVSGKTPAASDNQPKPSADDTRDDAVANAGNDESEADAEAALMGILGRADDEQEDRAAAMDSESDGEEAAAPDHDEAPDLAKLSNRLEAEDHESESASSASKIEDFEDDSAPQSAAKNPQTLSLEDEDYEALFASDNDSGQDVADVEEEPGHLTLDFELPEDDADEEMVSGLDEAARDLDSDPTESPDDDESAAGVFSLAESDSDLEVDGNGNVLSEAGVDESDPDELGAGLAPFELDDAQGDATSADQPPEGHGDEKEWFALDDDEQPAETSAVEPSEMPEDPDNQTSETEEAPMEEPAALADEDAEVKLDLARAYISMEDPDSARVLLEEVASDGSPSHREQAQKLMDSLR
jgi:pilus assembly protein FimV